MVNRHLAQQWHVLQLPLRRDVRFGFRLLGRRLLFHRSQRHVQPDPHRALERYIVVNRHLAQQWLQLPPRRYVRFGFRLLGRRLLCPRERHPDPHRALERHIVVNRHLAQQWHGEPPLRRDVRFGFRLLGRRFLF